MIEMKDLIYLRDKMKNKQSGFNFASYTVITDSYDDKVVALGIHKIDGSKDKAYVNFAMNWYKNSGYDCKINISTFLNSFSTYLYCSRRSYGF